MRGGAIARLSGLILGVVIVAIDGVGTAMALPAIQADLDASFSTLQWTISIYLMTVALTVVVMGRFGDMFGRRRIYLLALAAFGLGSLVCGLAPDIAVLLAGRVVQGFGGAGLYVLSLALVTSSVPRERIGSGVALWAAAAGVGMAIGPLVYGALVDLVDWRAVFLVNIPIVAVAYVLTVTRIEESSDPQAGRTVDVRGIALLTAGLGMLLLGIIQADAWGWTSPLTLGLIVLSAIPFALFVAVEDRVRQPLIELALFGKNAAFVAANAVGVGVYFTIYAVAFVMAIFLQDIQGHSAAEAALLLLPWPVAFALMAPRAGKLVPRVGAVPMMVGGSLGLAVSALMLGFADESTGELYIGGALLLFGIGQAFAIVAVSAAALGAVPREKAGAASGIRSTMAYVSASLGVAVVGAVLLVRERARLGQITEEDGRRLTTDEQQEIDGVLAGSEQAEARLGDYPPLQEEQIREAAGQAFSAGLTAGMVVCAGVLVAGVLLLLAITRRAAHRVPAPQGHPGLPPHPEPEPKD